MTGRRLLLCAVPAVFAISGLAACDENPPESAVESPTPTPTPDPAATPVAMTIPGDGSMASAAGRIEAPGEKDQFTFALTAGSRVRVDVDAQGMTPSSANLDAYLTLHAPDGSVAAFADDGTNVWDAGTTAPGVLRDPYLVATAGASGEYRLVLEDASGGGADNEEFDYRVNVSLVVSSALNGGIACAGAVPLPLLSGTSSVVSVSAGIDDASTDSCCDTTPLPCVGGTVAGRDVVYLAALTSGQRVQITRSGPSFDGAIYVTTDCIGNNTASIINSCEAGADGSDDADGVVFTPSITGNYYVHVDSVTGSNGLFTLDMRVLP